MKLSKKMLDTLNKQIVAEFESSYLYLSMAAYFDSASLQGMAGWMKAQAAEESTHAMKIYDYIQSRGGAVLLTAIKAPQTTWKSPKAVFEASLKHEQLVTSMIHNLFDLAHKEMDHASLTFLQWFINEQVEEEASVQEILDKFALTDGGKNALYFMDKELGGRGKE